MLKKIALQVMFVVALGVFAYSLVLFGALTANAQPSTRQANQGSAGNEPLRPPVAREMSNFLQLNTQEATAVRNILDNERQAMNALNESIRPQRDAIHQSTRKKLAASLSTVQLLRFDEWREANRPRRPPGEAGGNGSASAQNSQPR